MGPSNLPTTLDSSDLLSVVLASASSYPSAASRLTSIHDLPIPPAKLSASLIDIQPRIAKLEVLQVAQNADLAALRERSTAIIQRWYEVDILRAGESWVELQGRIAGVEQKLRRAEKAKRMEED
jgi:hypothetical protein